MKLLFISNITGRKVGSFSIASIIAAKELSYEYHIAANFRNSTPAQMESDEEKYGIHLHQIDFERNPLNPRNIKAFKQVVRLIQSEQFDLIHCNTPIGGVVGRLAGKKCNIQKIIYQAHGFHFYKGAPTVNWLVYYPIEKWLAHYTDALITINTEDYERAKHLNLRNHGKVYYIPGVGIDAKIVDQKANISKESLGIENNSLVLISVGELNHNKNHRVIIQALGMIKDMSIHYVACGVGGELENLKKKATNYGLSNNVHFLGYRNDVAALLNISDIFVMPSFREGLSRSIMEAMLAGLPCIVSDIRGNTDLIKDDICLCNPNDPGEFCKAIVTLRDDPNMRRLIGRNNRKRVDTFSIENVASSLKRAYIEIMKTK